MNQAEAYSRIIHAALPIANKDDRLPWYLRDKFGPPPRYDRIEVWYDPHTVENAIRNAQLRAGEIKSSDEIHRIMETVVQDAVQKALHKEWQAVGFLMLEDLRATTT